MSRHFCVGIEFVDFLFRIISGWAELWRSYASEGEMSDSKVIVVEDDPQMEEVSLDLDDDGRECARCKLDTIVPAGLVDNDSPRTEKIKSCGRLTGPLAIIAFLSIVFLILGREYLSQTLKWLEHLRLVPSIGVFVVLFTLVSFPFGFGYIILNMAAGYLYGFVRGQVVVSLSVAIGFSIAFFACRCCLKNWAMQYVSKSTTLLAMKRIVEGPHGIRVIVFTRFTPIPFGLQNTLFAITDVGFIKTIAASIVGLFPTQVINTYMGSTLRNMTEVLADRADGYIILSIQIVFSVFLSYYLIKKARQELAKLSVAATEEETDSASIDVEKG